MEVYRELANAVVVQAAVDYRTALRQLKRNPTYKKALRMRRDCERFFHSEWFQLLSGADGHALMEILKKEAEKNDSKGISESGVQA